MANSEDPGDLQPNAAINQGLHCLLRLKQPLVTEIHHILDNVTCDPLKYTMDNFNMFGKIHQNTKIQNNVSWYGSHVIQFRIKL